MAGGRKLKLTDDMQKDLLVHLEAGAFVEAAAEAVGLPSSTFHRYMEIGRDCDSARKMCEEEGRKWKPATENDERLLEFWESVTRARASAQITAVAAVHGAKDDDWRAAAWFLERSFPKQYGKRLLAPEQELSEPELTRQQSKIVAGVLRDAVKALGMDPNDDEVKALLRGALEKAATSG